MITEKFITNPNIISELKRLAEQSGGILQPQDVVEAARPLSSPLHNSFTWDESEAANKWRLHQARNLLRVTVEFVKTAGGKVPMRVFCSLKSDRESGGYRATVDIMSDRQMKNQLIEDALEDIAIFQKKYNHLRELAEVIAAMRRAKKKLKS